MKPVSYQLEEKKVGKRRDYAFCERPSCVFAEGQFLCSTAGCAVYLHLSYEGEGPQHWAKAFLQHLRSWEFVHSLNDCNSLRGFLHVVFPISMLACVDVMKVHVFFKLVLLYSNNKKIMSKFGMEKMLLLLLEKKCYRVWKKNQ